MTLTTAGTEGPAESIRFPRTFCKDRTLPYADPATIQSPTYRKIFDAADQAPTFTHTPHASH